MNKEHKSNKAKTVKNWIFQVLVLIAIVIAIIVLLSSSSSKALIILICLAVYVLYIINEFISHTSKFLCKKKSTQSCKNYMRTLFSTEPKVLFTCNCFHYDIYTKNESTTKEKVISFSTSEEMSYYSCRDISGLFMLNCDKEKVEKKKYIKLHLASEINFADELTFVDHESQKTIFYTDNRMRDEFMEFEEKRYIPGFEELAMITLNEEEPCSVHFGWFFLFTIIPFAEFYKLYIESLCIHQDFTIRKILSTRKDLNSPEIAKEYQNLNPRLNLIVNNYNFSPSDFCHVNINLKLSDPTQEELEKAKQYKSKVPKYELSNEGRVVDNPEYRNYDKNAPPIGVKPGDEKATKEEIDNFQNNNSQQGLKVDTGNIVSNLNSDAKENFN